MNELLKKININELNNNDVDVLWEMISDDNFTKINLKDRSSRDLLWDFICYTNQCTLTINKSYNHEFFEKIRAHFLPEHKHHYFLVVTYAINNFYSTPSQIIYDKNYFAYKKHFLRGGADKMKWEDFSLKADTLRVNINDGKSLSYQFQS